MQLVRPRVHSNTAYWDLSTLCCKASTHYFPGVRVSLSSLPVTSATTVLCGTTAEMESSESLNIDSESYLECHTLSRPHPLILVWTTLEKVCCKGASGSKLHSSQRTL